MYCNPHHQKYFLEIREKWSVLGLEGKKGFTRKRQASVSTGHHWTGHEPDQSIEINAPERGTRSMGHEESVLEFCA